MSPKKRVLQVEPFDDVTVIGISTTMSDYKFAWHLNNKLSLNLKKMAGMQGLDGQSGPFSFYHFDGGENENIFILLQLHNQGQKIMPLMMPLDYLMVIRNSLKPGRLDKMLSVIRAMKEVVAAWQLELTDIKGLDLLLEAVDFHEFSLSRPDPPRRIR